MLLNFVNFALKISPDLNHGKHPRKRKFSTFYDLK